MRPFVAAHLAVCLVLIVSAIAATATPARADQETDKARRHYETGLELFYAREHAQALVEFQRAHEVKPRPATVFMMGQCEYLLGSLRQARDHYEAYLRESPTGEFVEVAKDRVEAINRRPATLVINTVPDKVDVRITSAVPGARADGTGSPATAAATATATSPATAPATATTPSPAAAPATATTPSPAAAPATAVAPAEAIISGQAPNNFSVPHGRWMIAVSKPNYVPQTITVDVEFAETKPLFFKLEPIPARLEVETVPAGATLYVNGNRAQNPYRQDVSPGHIELFAQASDYEDRTEDFILEPGNRRLLTGPNAFHLRYVQRSGRPELVFASAAMGALLGAGAIKAVVATAEEATPGKAGNVASVSLTLGGALAGGTLGALLANRFVPSYVPDNRALFVIGGMWIGAAEGALTGMFLKQAFTSEVPGAPSSAASDPPVPARPPHLAKPALSDQLKWSLFGSIPGIVIGTTAGSLLTKHAPTYGRVALIQSAAVGGAVVGGLAAVALQWKIRGWKEIVSTQDQKGNVVLTAEPSKTASILDLALPSLIGLNVGLASGLLGAYLPDQSRYGPSWGRIALIDLAAGAGALAGGIAACVADNVGCLTANPDAPARARTAGVALLGGGAGLVLGILLTRNLDQVVRVNPTATPLPSLTLLPIPNGTGGVTPVLSAVGFF